MNVSSLRSISFFHSDRRIAPAISLDENLHRLTADRAILHHLTHHVGLHPDLDQLAAVRAEDLEVIDHPGQGRAIEAPRTVLGFVMKTIGLIGGMSWESTALYYRRINEITRDRLGGLHSAKIAMISLDFAEVEKMQEEGDWRAAGDLLASAARRLEAAGAELILICANTMHLVADTVASAVSVPLVHLADATAQRAVRDGLGRVGLLGTRYTMEKRFYIDRLEAAGLDVVVPESADRDLIHRVIYEELCLGVVRDESRERWLAIIEGLVGAGAEAIIAGCTEIGMLISENDIEVPLLDTTEIHAEVAVEASLETTPAVDPSR